jgi:hypothetical protein
VSVTSPSFAVASTPTATVRSRVSTSFAMVVRSSRRGYGGLDVVCRCGLHAGHGSPRVAGPSSDAKGGQRADDQEHGDQAGPDPGLGPVAGPAQRTAVQPQRAGQPRSAPRPARHRLHREPPQPLTKEITVASYWPRSARSPSHRRRHSTPPPLPSAGRPPVPNRPPPTPWNGP